MAGRGERWLEKVEEPKPGMLSRILSTTSQDSVVETGKCVQESWLGQSSVWLCFSVLLAELILLASLTLGLTLADDSVTGAGSV